MDHQKFLQRAARIAHQNVADCKGGPFGCIIVSDSRIIAEAVNQVTTLNDPTAHAEVQAIRQACKHLNSFSLENCTLYTSCEPCPMCLSAIYWARIPEIYFANSKETAAQYGFDDQFIYDEISNAADLRKIRMKKINIEEGLSAFQLWRSSSQKIPY